MSHLIGNPPNFVFESASTDDIIPMNNSVTATIKVAYEEGGEWRFLRIHSLEMPDGKQWDALNGWRKEGSIE